MFGLESVWRRVGLGLGLVPLASMLGYATASGVPVAQGCGGSGSFGDGWVSLAIVRQGDGPVASVATDGFFVMRGQTRNLKGPAAVQSVVVKVTTDAGDAVDGSVTLLYDAPNQYSQELLGWSAAKPLAVGTLLHAVVTAPIGPGNPAPVSDQLDLTVAGEPTELAPGTLDFASWVDFRHGVGEMISCTRGDSCGGLAFIPAEEIKQHAANATWAPAEARGFVAWQAEILLMGGAADAILPTGNATTLFNTTTPQDVGLLVFPSQATSYCAYLRVRDLRSGAMQLSPVVCRAPAPGRIETDTLLFSCDAPPNAALTETWCAVRGANANPACAPFSNGGSGGIRDGVAGSFGGVIGGSSGVDRAGSPGSVGSLGGFSSGGATGTGPNPSQPVPESSAPHTSRSCQLSVPTAGGASSASLLAALGLAGVLRRRRVVTRA